MKTPLALLSFVPSAVLLSAALMLAGCTPSQSQQPVTMAPPISQPPPQAAAPGNGSVYQWQDVPAGQQIPVTRAVFDQGGYQIYAQTGETILVPFANQNLYVMKFGISNTGQMYFVSDGTTPTLFVPRGTGLENASAQGARWYPFSQDYQYQRPVYVGIAPSWNAFTGMGWYPGMSYYGGYWGYNPYRYGYSAFSPMTGIIFNIGGHPYYGWNSYSTYYRSNPRYAVRPARTFNYASTGRQAPGSFGRNRGTGSFGTSRNSGGSYSSSRPTGGGTGSFGSRRTSGSGGFSSAPPSGSGGFGRSGSNNTFGTATNRPAFGSGSSTSSGASPSGGTSGFGGFGRRSSGGGSFGSSTSGSSSGYRPFGGSSTRSSGGGSFGGGSFGRSSSGSSGGFGRSSSGGGGFGGGSFGRSSGGGFGGRRR